METKYSSVLHWCLNNWNMCYVASKYMESVLFFKYLIAFFCQRAAQKIYTFIYYIEEVQYNFWEISYQSLDDCLCNELVLP